MSAPVAAEKAARSSGEVFASYGARMSRFRAVLLVGFALTAVPTTPAFASLGGDVRSIDDDRVRMQGALRQIARRDAFTLHELQTATGVVVREFATSSGTVYAVAWQGPVFPDMRQLLGPYFDRYQQEAARLAQSRRGHGPLTIDLGDVVVQTGGHARAFSGRAYVPRLLPAGVAVESIR
jgi:hypothetical protein